MDMTNSGLKTEHEFPRQEQYLFFFKKRQWCNETTQISLQVAQVRISASIIKIKEDNWKDNPWKKIQQTAEALVSDGFETVVGC